MELKTLQYFVRIAREESITRAANALHITQPTLSRQIKDLEKELNVKLFNRRNHNIQLTDEGVLLKNRAEALIEMSNKIQDEFKVIDKNIEGNVYIGCGETKGMEVIANIFNDIQDDYPNIHFHIYSGNADDIASRLDKGLLDFGILIQPVNLNKYKSLYLSTSDHWGIIAKKDDVLAQKSDVIKEDLVDKPLICSRQVLDTAIDKNDFTEWFGDLFNHLNIVGTFNLAYNAGWMVKAGLGYAITLDSIIDTSKESELTFIPLEPRLISKHNLVWRKDHTFSKAAQLFLDKAIDVCQ
ncbi:LysR family transcriptional regulator [Staphylococcus edaphicus]|uniref:LysR family transcriptional regulator n=2 Tax=Staphylococcus TaxID=1279 RepID=A0A2C6U598_9STAP|nr:LysR family transcriptional regulator [Staphylococcus edaphicus]PHK49032.1 LysR family transcriptional regulator [Staphylococcus edaphicus]UQW81356.1 LysR family transcriptional regulator [Staphylococcus edaphicus]